MRNIVSFLYTQNVMLFELFDICYNHIKVRDTLTFKLSLFFIEHEQMEFMRLTSVRLHHGNIKARL